MGRITIFTVSDCLHCDRAKSAFASRGFAYTEISLSDYPERRTDMLSLSDRLTVPQVFFNDTYIGGADETLSLLDKWDSEAEEPVLLDRFRKEVESLNGPHDKRLSIPTEPPLFQSSPEPERKLMDESFELPDGKMVSEFEMTKTLMEIMPRADLSYLARIYKNCFKGRDGVAKLMSHFNLTDVEEAIALGRNLQRKQMLHHVCDDNHVFGESDYYFRLQPFHRPNILNSFRVWDTTVDQNAVALLSRIKTQMGRIISSWTDETGVDYLAAADDPKFLVFEEAVCELQSVNFASMDHETKLAFGINLYNVMITHAFVKVGTPKNSMSRAVFFSDLCYDIGGDVLSLDDLEHGVLRANSRPPYRLKAPFSKDDTRIRLKLKKLDNRIHFGLSCGAKSCPPVKNFNSQSIEEELRIVSQAFCSNDDNVYIDEKSFEISVTMLFKWYQSDFVESSSQLPAHILKFLRSHKRERLQKMIESGKTIKVKFLKYDWSTNATKSKTFESNITHPNEVTIRAFSRNPAYKDTLPRAVAPILELRYKGGLHRIESIGI